VTVFPEYVMTDMPLEDVTTCLIAEKAQILIFQLSLNILCANILIYCTFHRQKKVITVLHPKHTQIVVSRSPPKYYPKIRICE
jgi:hypothetical protein